MERIIQFQIWWKTHYFTNHLELVAQWCWYNNWLVSGKLNVDLWLANTRPIKTLFNLSAIQFYSTTIFETAGMADPAFGTVMVGVLKVCCVSITIFIVDRFGRKKLMILSLGGKIPKFPSIVCSKIWNRSLPRTILAVECLNLFRNAHELYFNSYYPCLFPGRQFVYGKCYHCGKFDNKHWNWWCIKHFFDSVSCICFIVRCFLSIWCWTYSSIYHLRNVSKFYQVRRTRINGPFCLNQCLFKGQKQLQLQRLSTG